MRKASSEDISQELKDQIYQAYLDGNKIVDLERLFPTVSNYRIVKEVKRCRESEGVDRIYNDTKLITADQLTEWGKVCKELKSAVRSSEVGEYITKSGLGFKVVNKI